MAYSDFTLERVERELQLRLDMETLFDVVEPVEPPEYLTEWLRRGEVMPLTSEKARNERIIAPILMTVAELSGVEWTVFSGHTMSVDPHRGLTGECDFLVANTEPVPVLRAPLLVVVEAKRGELEVGMGQCAAQMLAARTFNQNAGSITPRLYGCTTNGWQWQFLRLDGETLSIDRHPLPLEPLGRLLGVLLHILREVAQR